MRSRDFLVYECRPADLFSRMSEWTVHSVLNAFPCDFPCNALLRLELERMIGGFIVIMRTSAGLFPTTAVLGQVIELSFCFVVDWDPSLVLGTVVVPALRISAALHWAKCGFEGEDVTPMVLFAHVIAIRSVLGWWA